MRTDTSSDIRGLLEENIKISKQILASTEKTRKQMRWTQIWSFIRLIIIIIPLVLAILYIPPFLSKLSGTFGKLYGGEQFNILELLKGQGTSPAAGTGPANGAGGINIDDVKSFLNKQIK
ncbi:MAG: hypothetical protein V1661_01895 [bacterium]